MAIYQSVEELTGRTPLVRLGRFTASRGAARKSWASWKAGTQAAA